MEDCNKLYLEFVNDDEGNLLRSDEPTGWSDVTLNMSTPDRKMFGRNFSFSNSEIALTFESSFDTQKYGHHFKKLLEYDSTYGAGACVRFYYESCGEILLLGRLNFKGAVTDGCSYFDVNIIQDQKANTLIEQEDTSADIKSDNTLNDLDGFVVPFETMCLKSKAFVESASQGANSSDGSDVDYFENPLLIQWSGSENGEKQGTAPLYNDPINQDIDVLNHFFYSNEGNALPIDSYSFSFREDFTDVEVDLNLGVGVAMIRGNKRIDYADYSIHLILRDFEGNTIQQNTLLEVLDFDLVNVFTNNIDAESAYLEGILDSDFLYYNINQSFNYSNISAGSTITVYGRTKGNPVFNVGVDRSLRTWTRTLKESTFTVRGTSKKEDTVHQIPRLKDVFTKIVDYVTDAEVTVSMPEFEQGGEHYDYFLPNGYEVRGAIENRQYAYDFKKAMSSINAIFAAGYQLNGDEVFIGSVKEFYKPINMGLLDYPVVDYVVRYDKDLLLNQFEFKYKKVPKDELNTIDEFNTSAKSTLPNQKIKGNCKVESDFIGSGYLLEIERRKQFTENPTESSSLDDDIFIVNGVFDEELGKYVNRTIENIDNVDNLISPETSYNLAISPLQNFARWFPYVGSSTHYHSEYNEIVTTFFEHNEFMQSQILDSSALNTTQIQKDRFDKSIFNQHIFEPREVDITLVNVPIQKVLSIQNDLINTRGFYQIKDKKNQLKDVFILEYEYKPIREELTLTAILKNEFYTV